MVLTCLIAPWVMLTQSPVELKYRPEVGKTYKYVLSTKMTQKVGSAADTKRETSMSLDMTALSRDGDLTTIESKVVDAKVTDSDEASKPGQAKQIEDALKNQVTKMVVDSHFHPADVEVTGPAASFAQGLRQSLEAIRFPDKPVMIGDSWTNNMDLSGFLKGMEGVTLTGKIPIVCKLESVQDGKVKIAINATGTAQITGPKGTVDMKIATIGYDLIDLATGVMLEVKSFADNSIEFSGTTIIQHIDQTIEPRP